MVTAYHPALVASKLSSHVSSFKTEPGKLRHTSEKLFVIEIEKLESDQPLIVQL